jgi:hypothetical protein
MGKDSIRLLVAINKRLNFRTQRDSKILAGIDSNSLGNRWRRVTGKYAFSELDPEDRRNDQSLICRWPVQAFGA